MSTTTSSAVRPGGTVTGRATFGGAVRSEWTKLWSLRSTTWSIVALVVITVGLSVLISWGNSSSYDDFSPADQATLDPTNISLSGFALGQLVAAVLGVLVISSEYSTGNIRTSLAAVPRRLNVLGAKAVVVAVAMLLAGLVTAFLSFFLGQLFFARIDLAASLGDPGVLRAVIGAGLYVMGCALFGLAVGALLRNTAGAVTTVVALLFLLPLLSNLLPGSWGSTITKWFTQNAGSQIATTVQDPDLFGPWAGYAAFTFEWAIVLAVAAVLLVRRDS